MILIKCVLFPATYICRIQASNKQVHWQLSDKIVDNLLLISYKWFKEKKIFELFMEIFWWTKFLFLKTNSMSKDCGTYCE